MRWSIRHGWRRHAFRTTAAVTLIALAFSTASVRAADPAPSNLDLLERMTSEIVAELYGKFGPELGGRTVELRPFASGEDYVFVGNVFTDVLTSRGVATIAPAAPGGQAVRPAPGAGSASMPAAGGVNPESPPPSPDNSVPATPSSNHVVLTFQNVSFAIAYPDVYRSHVFGGKHVKRLADVRVHATVTDGHSGQVLWVGEASRESADEFDYDDSARVEQGTYQFARPVLPGGGWGKYAEPVFVTGIIVGLIYLFFSNQSDN